MTSRNSRRASVSQSRAPRASEICPKHLTACGRINPTFFQNAPLLSNCPLLRCSLRSHKFDDPVNSKTERLPPHLLPSVHHHHHHESCPFLSYFSFFPPACVIAPQSHVGSTTASPRSAPGPPWLAFSDWMGGLRPNAIGRSAFCELRRTCERLSVSGALGPAHVSHPGVWNRTTSSHSRCFLKRQSQGSGPVIAL